MSASPSRRNWAGNVIFGASEVHTPATVDDLRRVVAAAHRVRAVGSGHSFSRIADTDGVLVDLSGLPPLVAVDVTNSQVTVGAGMTFAQVLPKLHAAGAALADLASLPHLSIAGAVATGTHGSGVDRGGLATHVAAVELVGPDGDLSWIRRGDTEFEGVVVALGALGVVTRLVLDTQPAFDMTQQVAERVPLDCVEADLRAVFAAGYSVSIFTDFLAAESTAHVKRRTDTGYPDPPGGTWAREALHAVPGLSPDFCTPQLGIVGPWHERLAHFRAEFVPSVGEELQSEYFVPRSHAADAFAQLRTIGHLIAPAVHIAEIRTVGADDLWLSPAYERDAVTFHFTWYRDEQLISPVMAKVEQVLAPFEPRPHWGKLTAHAPHQSAALYPRAADFARLRRGRDPQGKFCNSFVDALLAEVDCRGGLGSDHRRSRS